MRYKVIGSGLALLFMLAGCGEPTQQLEDLPWQVTVSPEGNSQVFHLQTGKTTLKEAIERFHSFPELAVFSHESGKRHLEAYFGKLTLGVFEAKLLLELQADDATLTNLQQASSKREGMASGQWKFEVAEASLPVVNNVVVRKVVYMPAIDYAPDIVTARFGAPAEKIASAQKGVEYWFYPQKGLAMLLNSAGGDLFYYTDAQHYAALKQELLESKPTHD